MIDPLAELLSSKVRAVVLAHLLPRPHLGFGLTDLARRLDLPISSLQHECYKLTRLGVLWDERTGGARLYRPNPDSPLLAPLTALVVATIGREAALAGAVDGVPGLEFAAVAGTHSPVPNAIPLPCLVLVGELALEEVDAALARAADVLAMPLDRIELAFFRPVDWAGRRSNDDRYIADLLGSPLLLLHGRRDFIDVRGDHEQAAKNSSAPKESPGS